MRQPVQPYWLLTRLFPPLKPARGSARIARLVGIEFRRWNRRIHRWPLRLRASRLPISQRLRVFPKVRVCPMKGPSGLLHSCPDDRRYPARRAIICGDCSRIGGLECLAVHRVVVRAGRADNATWLLIPEVRRKTDGENLVRPERPQASRVRRSYRHSRCGFQNFAERAVANTVRLARNLNPSPFRHQENAPPQPLISTGLPERVSWCPST